MVRRVSRDHIIIHDKPGKNTEIIPQLMMHNILSDAKIPNII